MRTIVAATALFLSSMASAYDYYFQDVKVLSVHPFYGGDYVIKINLDLSAYATDAFLTNCAPTRDAWVVTAWGFSQDFESQILTTASLAMANGDTVDVYLHDTVCDTNAGYPNMPTPGSPSATMSQPSIPSGSGRRVYGLRIHPQ